MKAHFVRRPGGRAHRRVLRYRPGTGAVYEKPGDRPHGDGEQWKRIMICLLPRDRLEVLEEFITRLA